MKSKFALAAAIGGMALTSAAQAQVLFSDDLNTNSSSDYTVLEFNPARDGANFAFDYSDYGIPEAPNSAGNGRTGLQLYANDGTATGLSAVQVVPNGLTAALAAADRYSLTYDLWLNFNGPAPAGGSGSTEAMMVGAGFSAAAPINTGNIDGTYFTIHGDNYGVSDVRTFTNDGETPAEGFNHESVEVPGGYNTNAEYYHGIFPGGVDIATFGQGGSQTGVTDPGQMAFAWHEIRLDVDNVAETVSFYVDDLLIARDSTADVDGEVFFGYTDYYGSGSDPVFSFGVVDNVVVAVPEPASLSLLGLGGLAALRRRRA